MKQSVVRGLGSYLSLASAILLIVMGKFLFFKAAYLFKDIGSDSLNIFYPQIRHLFAYLRTDGLPGWSFSQGLGQNIFPFSWDDPFYLIMFPFQGERFPFGIAYMESAKILFAGAFFYLYLRELSLTGKTAVTGALLFSFSGYIIVGSPWTTFSTEAVCCALLLYAFERFLKRGSWGLIPAAIAILTLLQPFLLYPFALFFAPYGVVRYLEEKGNDPRGCAEFMFRFAFLALLGAAMSGVLLFSDVSQMLHSARVAGKASFFGSLSANSIFRFVDPEQGLTALLRLYSNDLTGSGSNFRGWGNFMEAPLCYCGLVCLLLVPQAFAAMDRRRRKLYGAFAAVVLLPFVFPYFRYLFWAFSGDYYRTLSLFAAVFLLFIGMRALNGIDESSRVNRAALAASLAIVLVVLYALPAAAKAHIDEARRGPVAGFLIAYAALILSLSSKKARRPAWIALLLLICVEAAWSSWRAIDEREVVTAQELSRKTGYEDATNDAVAYLNSTDSSFFRLEKDYRSSPTSSEGDVGRLNDAKVQGYRGTSSYDRFNQPSYIDFLAEMGLIDPTNEHETRWLTGLGVQGKLISLVDVKYVLFKNPPEILNRFPEIRVGKFGDVSVFRNPDALPLGFAYDHCLTLDQFRKLDAPGKSAALLDAFIAKDDSACLGFPNFIVASAAPANDGNRYAASLRARRSEVLSITAHSQNAIDGDIRLPKRRLLFFSIPYDAGWTASVGGKIVPLARVDIGFMGLPLDAGAHHVELRFEPPLRRLGVIVSLIALTIYALLLGISRSRRL